MASLALANHDIDHCVPKLSLRIGARWGDKSVAGYEASNPLYNVNLLFLPHYETIRLAASDQQCVMASRYNIACWQWELPRFPHGLECSIDLVDEIWSSTSYTAQAMREATDKPVLVMPMAVALPMLTRTYSRADFGLPGATFLYLAKLDGHSGVVRKNPLAVVRAFQRAFPPSETNVHLAIKAMNLDQAACGEWAEVVQMASSDPRITLLSEVMARERVVGLQSVCDCFVSLHRAEGFGRNIAEAMLLGKPVVVSAFSGNMDFTDEETAFLVQGDLVRVSPGEYPFHQGQVWLDPDLEAAADAMMRVVDDPTMRNRRAAKGREVASARYAPEVVGRRYLQRLKSLMPAPT